MIRMDSVNMNRPMIIEYDFSCSVIGIDLNKIHELIKRICFYTDDIVVMTTFTYIDSNIEELKDYCTNNNIPYLYNEENNNITFNYRLTVDLNKILERGLEFYSEDNFNRLEFEAFSCCLFTACCSIEQIIGEYEDFKIYS